MYKAITLKEIEPLQKSARGRNGWFRPQTIEVNFTPSWSKPNENEIAIAIYSKRQGGEPPIYLRIPLATALDLASTINSFA